MKISHLGYEKLILLKVDDFEDFKTTTDKLQKRNNVIKKLAGNDWGCFKDDIKGQQAQCT